jgi:hypothetical protein
MFSWSPLCLGMTRWPERKISPFHDGRPSLLLSTTPQERSWSRALHHGSRQYPSLMSCTIDGSDQISNILETIVDGPGAGQGSRERASATQLSSLLI